MKWNSLCQPKANGGMGFKDLALFNDAILAKQAWCLLQNKQSLSQKYSRVGFSLHVLSWMPRSVLVVRMHGVVYSKAGRSSNKMHNGE